ncbi:3D domain-containing protein [Tissierella praeacuta]|uniref:3D domain-containing protein n=1 Tax=Tissierella praeacuta TaxID=43131 RepID=UPI001404E750|nr:3D domain-containing protein [Tissierella praeacuta]
MRTINKDTKTDILKWATAIVLATISIVAHLTVTNELEKLETEIVELTKQKEYLTQLKTHYEELIKLQDELEINLNFQIEILENNLTKLQEENEQLRTIRAKLTAYSPLDNRDGQQAEGNPNRTSIGKQVSRGIVAADPRKLPYGTKLEIPDWGVVEVGDTGAALRNDDKNIRIDLFHSTYKDAMKFGVKDTEVKILEWGAR